MVKVSLVYNTYNHDAYSLKVKSTGILITAGSELGVFYALQTLRQVMRLDVVEIRMDLNATGKFHMWTLPMNPALHTGECILM